MNGAGAGVENFGCRELCRRIDRGRFGRFPFAFHFLLPSIDDRSVCFSLPGARKRIQAYDQRLRLPGRRKNRVADFLKTELVLRFGFGRKGHFVLPYGGCR